MVVLRRELRIRGSRGLVVFVCDRRVLLNFIEARVYVRREVEFF